MVYQLMKCRDSLCHVEKTNYFYNKNLQKTIVMATKKTTTKKTTKNGVTVTTTTTTTSSSTKKRRKRTSGTQIIPGVNLTISWKKLLGITKLKRWFTNKTGIPTTEAGIERKLGRWLIGLITGGNKKEEKKKEQFIDADVSNQPTDMLSNNSFEEKEG